MRVKKYIYNSKGITLVELMIATAVLGLLAQLMAVNFAGNMPKHRLKGAARNVMLNLMSARMKAISFNQNIMVKFINGHEYMIGTDQNNNGDLDVGEGETNNIQDEYHNVTFTAPLPPMFTFSSRGFSDRLSTITLANSSGSKSITVALTGRVKIN
jgi:type IV fimbrial biogenesis protein FimT